MFVATAPVTFIMLSLRSSDCLSLTTFTTVLLGDQGFESSFSASGGMRRTYCVTASLRTSISVQLHLVANFAGFDK